jgi:hypothetical protein
MAANPGKASEVAVSGPSVSEGQLSEITTFDDALALVQDVFGGQIVEADKTLGTGFAVLDDKNRLLGVAFIAVKIDQHATGDHGPFTSLHVVTQDGRKYIINDGGTGIHGQITELYSRKPELIGLPLLVRQGLRRSDYVHPEHGPSVTFYLNTSASE